MKYHLILLFLPLFIFLVACSGKSPNLEETAKTEITKEAIQATLQEAEEKRKEASKLGHEWRFTKSRIQEATKLLEQGELEKAQALAARALHEAKTAVWQYHESKKTWMYAVPQ